MVYFDFCTQFCTYAFNGIGVILQVIDYGKKSTNGKQLEIKFILAVIEMQKFYGPLFWLIVGKMGPIF